MLCFSDNSMQERLKYIWSEAFGDPAEYIDFYFKHAFKPSQTAVYLDNGAPVAMLTILDMELLQGKTMLKAGYIYAVATLPLYRSRGIGARLMHFAHQQCALRGMSAAILIPAEKSLFDYYGNLGYESCFKVKEAAADAPDCACAPVRLSGIGADELYRMRRSCFSDGRLFAGWAERELDYMLSENSFLGGHAFTIEGSGFRGHALCRVHDETLHIKELAVPDKYIDEAVYALCKRLSASRYTLRLRCDSAFDGSLRELGMIRWLDGRKRCCNAAYMSLGLE